MSITNNGGIYDLDCDVCGKTCGTDFDSFTEAVEWKKKNKSKWHSSKSGNCWLDVCHICWPSVQEKIAKGEMR